MKQIPIEEGLAFRGLGWEVRVGAWQDSPPEVVDHIITDPPYDEDTHKNAMYAGGERFGIPAFDPIAPEDFTQAFLMIAERWVVCFGTTEMMGGYKAAAGDSWIRSGWWRKPNGSPQRSGDRPAVPGEAIAIMHRPGRKVWNGGGKHGFWVHNACRRDRFHPTQKPVALCRELIEDFTDEGDLIWDPFGGSMAMGVAAIITGRRYLAHELNPEWAKKGVERLEAATHGITREDWLNGQLGLFQLG